MTREQAIEKANDASLGASFAAAKVVGMLEALGLIKFDEPAPKTHRVPALSYQDHCGNLSALVREDTLVETLRMAGFCVIRDA